MFEIEILRVSKTSEPGKLAGAIAGTINEHEQAILQTIGAGAVNQAVKAVAIARGFLRPRVLVLL